MTKVANAAALNSEQSDRGKGTERKYTYYSNTGGQIKKQYCHKVKGAIVQRGLWGWTVWVGEDCVGGASATYMLAFV